MFMGKKVAAAALVCALIAFGGVSLVGCGPSAEEVVREGVSSELDSLKNLDETRMAELVEDVDAAELTEFGIEPEEFIAAYLDGFDYRIDDVTVDGDTAKATVVLTSKSFSAFTKELESASAKLAGELADGDVSDDETNQRIGQVVMDALAAVPAVEAEPVELTFALEGTTWTPTPDAENALANALFSN